MKNFKLAGTIITISIFLSFSAFSQITKVPNLKLYDFETLHFGFTLATNQMDFVLEPKDNINQIFWENVPVDNDLQGAYAARIFGIQANSSVGFSVSIVGDLRLGNYFNFRFIPTLSFGRRELLYDMELYDEDFQFKSQEIIIKKINSTFVDFPLLLKYKSKRDHNMRAYVIGGVKFSLDLASQANKDEENNYDPKLYRSDTYGTLGAGFDIYMNWFKFGIEVTMSYGIRDILLREGNLYTDSIESLRSKVFMLTFTFE